MPAFCRKCQKDASSTSDSDSSDDGKGKKKKKGKNKKYEKVGFLEIKATMKVANMIQKANKSSSDDSSRSPEPKKPRKPQPKKVSHSTQFSGATLVNQANNTAEITKADTFR